MNDKFKSQVVLELEKDKLFHSSNEFYRKIEEKYGFKPDSDLYKAILNYQVERYGKQLDPRFSRSKVKTSAKIRIHHKDRQKINQESNRIVERIENEKENMVHTRETS